MTRLERLKALLGVVDGTQDAMLTALLDAEERKILNYIGHDTLPAELDPVVVEAAVDSYRLLTQPGSVRMGDTSHDWSTNRLSDRIKAQLVRFRRVAW